MKKSLITAATVLALAASMSTAVAATQSPQTKVNNPGIEHVTKTVMGPDGSVVSVTQSWENPVNHDEKIVVQDGNTHELWFRLNEGRQILKLFTNAAGQVINGVDVTLPQGLSPQTPDLFATEKARFQGAGWTNEGTLQSDGTTLQKWTKVYAPAPPANANYSETVYLNPQTGLPVKGTIYKLETGQLQLLYTESYQEQTVANSASLFSTRGLNLTNVQKIAQS